LLITLSFKELLNEISTLLAYEATQSLELSKQTIDTPLESCEVELLTGKKPVILPILRAGLGMVDGFLNLMPSSRVGHIGMYRDEKTLQPHCYYFKIPKESTKRKYFVCDPMLATGGTAVATIDRLKKEGITDMVFICVLAAPEGLNALSKAHPDLPIYAASLDRELNQHSYILPGVGDAGDRLFGTR